MRLFGEYNGRTYDLEDRPLISCGEGKIHKTDQPQVIAKILHKPTPERAQKIRELIGIASLVIRRFGEHQDIVLPEDLLVDDNGTPCGHTMAWVEDCHPIAVLLDAATRIENYPIATYRDLLGVLINLCAVVIKAHKTEQIVFGDFNENNFLVGQHSTQVVAIDLDGTQVRAFDGTLFRCEVGTEDYTSPEHIDADLRSLCREPSADFFSLAIMIHQVLLNAHPYDGRWTGKSRPPHIRERIKNKLLALPKSKEASGWFLRRSKGQVIVPEYAIPKEVLPDEINNMFRQAFIGEPERRPTASDWFDALKKLRNELCRCTSHRNHWFYEKLFACPFCWLKREQQLDFFPPVQSQPKNGRQRRKHAI